MPTDDGAPDLAPHLRSRLSTQVDTWRRDLLTLDRRQKLVYFKHTRTASCEIGSPTPEAAFELLPRGPLPVLSDEDDVVPRTAVVVQGKTPAEVLAACRRLDLNARQVYADRGFWTLYLGLGMLRWVDADGRTAEAPIALCPVELERTGKSSPYRLSLTDDDVVVNPALRLALEKTHGVHLPLLDVDATSIADLLDQVALIAATRPGWQLERRTVMTTFSFHKEAIYRDLEDHERSVVSHPVVRLLALGADAPDADRHAFPVPGSQSPLDDEHPPEQLLSILDADSSQRTCILAARAGQSFVMDGPPGTGKSQTIANIVAELIAAGRTVLFVSEKAAALDVVRDRLAAKGLGDFMLELHSHAATRKEVVRQLNESLTQRTKVLGGFGDGQKQILGETRRQLTAHALAMNELRSPMDRSLVEVVGRVSQLADVAHAPVQDVHRWSTLSAGQLDELLGVAGRLANAWRPVSEGPSFLWHGLASGRHTASTVDTLRSTTRDLGQAAEALVARLKSVDEDLGTSWRLDESGAVQRLTLLELLEARPEFPPSWWTLDDPAALGRRSTSLRAAVETYEEADERLVAVIGTDAVERLDPDRCAAADAPVTSPDTVWSPDGSCSTDTLAATVERLQEAPIRLAEVLEDARHLGSLLGIPTDRISLRRCMDLAHLGALGGAAALPERAWLNPAVQSALDESLRVLNSVVELVNDRRAAVEAVFTPAALEADLQGLDVRFRETHTGLRAFSGAARADKKVLRSLTVSGKADKSVRARLPEAVAWQKAEAALAEAERSHAGRLGGYYERTSTDFARLGEAILTARRAIELAGNDLNGGPLCDQLSRDGSPDPRLTVIAERLLVAAREWLGGTRALIGEATEALLDLPLDVAADRCRRTAVALVPLLEACQHVSDVAGRQVTIAAAATAHVEGTRRSAALAAIFDSYDEDVAALGPSYSGLTSDWDALEKAMAWVVEVRSLMGGPARERQVPHLLRPMVLSSDVRERLDVYRALKGRWLAYFEQTRAIELGADLAGDLADAGELLRDMHDSCVRDVAERDAHVEAVDELVAAGLATCVQHLLSASKPAEDVVPSVEWAVLQAWAEVVIESDQRLTRLRSADRDALVQKFRDLDAAQVAQANLAVAALCSSRRPASLSGASAQLIRREALKKTRHLPIRELLTRTHEIVSELKPCFMMSPLSVSQFLPGEMRFDAVIFDEASQVLPSDAVNCIYRGTQLIVAGDEKQLPPTSFFAQAVSDDDVDDELDLFESVLKSCKSSLPSLPLTWHYRSQHESLISFSNHRFYAPDGQALQTFPGAVFDSPDLGVASYVVDGTYRKGSTRDNPVEADAVVDRVLFHRRHHPELSLGVVTFSSAQEDAISAALDRRSATEPELAGLLDDHDRLSGFFVKNLENVQGDERDIIIFSIGYGPDETGAFSMNFGPINRDGGWRRLNVAITRARRRVEVVSSFRASQMRETSSEGLAALRGYLDFAERGMRALGLEDRDTSVDSGRPLEDDVARSIRSWGYDVLQGVGASGYRVDIGVRHPDRPGEYVLAVECDGSSYASAATARDRERLRTNVLHGLGWHTHRVWGVAWYRDRQGEELRLRAAIESAVRGGAPTPTAPSQESVESGQLVLEEVDLEARPAWAEPYGVCSARAPWLSYNLGDVESRPAIQSYLRDLLVAEAPIHRDLVFKRVREAFGVGRVGSNIRANIEFVAGRLTIGDERVSVDDAGFFRTGSQVTVRFPEDEDDVRTVAQTPPEELDLAVVLTVRDAVTLEEDGLINAVRNVFGWRRAGADIQGALLTAVDRCLSDGRLRRTAGGLLRAE